MASMAMMAVSLAFSAMQTGAQNSALRKQQAARDRTAQRQVEELKRQQERADLVAQEEKSDRAREMDIQLGTLIAAAADGGVTDAALARAGASSAAIAGLDTARIESNRQEEQSQRRADSISIIEENAAQRAQTRSQIKQNTLGFFGNAVGSVFNFAFNATPSTTPAATATGSSNLVGFTSLDARAGMKGVGRRRL